jgi:6-pyruvoyltetrahydropterin/6-carboxytetrahydropterin synthase
VPAFTGENTTTEFLANAIFDRVVLRIQAGELTNDARRLAALRVTLAESHLAKASYVSGLSLGQ